MGRMQAENIKLTSLMDGSEPLHSSLRLKGTGLHWHAGITSFSFWLHGGSYILSVEPSWREGWMDSGQSVC